MNWRKRIPALLIACAMLTGCSQAPVEEEPFSIESIRPGDDFYGWCNAKALTAMELTEDSQSAGSYADTEVLVNDQLDSIISEIAAQTEPFPPGSDEQLVHDLYHLALTDANAAYDEELIAEVVDYVDETQSMEELFDVWGNLYYYYGTPVVAVPYIDADLYDHTVNQVWIAPFKGFDGWLISALGDAQTAAYYRDDLALMLMLTGSEESDAYTRADAVMYTLLDIAAAADTTLLPGSDFIDTWHPYTEDELNKRARHLDFETLMWITGIDENPTGQVILEDPEQFFVIDKLLDDEHLQVWKDCTVWAFLETYREELPTSFDALTNRSAIAPEEYALTETKALLKSEVGALYAQRYEDPETCKAVEMLCRKIIDQYKKMIEGADWLSDEGKTALTEKLRSMVYYVGAGEPNEIYEEDASLIGETLLDTAINYRALMAQATGYWLGIPAEPSASSLMLPQEVNAVYDPRSNSFLVPTAYMNPPFFDAKADETDNLAGLGATVAHEISHAFDSDGIHFKANGDYDPEWLPDADRKAFETRMQRTAEYYSRFAVIGSSHVNGTQTLAENLADIGGLQCVLGMAETPEQQKQLFESYSQTEAELTFADDTLMLLDSDTHSPASVRVNAVVACFDEFYEIYDVQPGDALYIAPEDRVRRW